MYTILNAQKSKYYKSFLRLVQEIYDFGQRLFGLVLAGYVGKAFAGLGLHIDLGIALAEGHGVSAHSIHHKAA